MRMRIKIFRIVSNSSLPTSLGHDEKLLYICSIFDLMSRNNSLKAELINNEYFQVFYASLNRYISKNQ